MTEREHLDLIRKKTGYVEARGGFDTGRSLTIDPRLSITLDDLAFLIGGCALASFDTDTEDWQ